MKIFPAIDLYGGKAVRLYKGDYNQMTVFSDSPVSVAESFRGGGAEHLHIVDLEGAKTGRTSNAGLVNEIVRSSGLRVQIGGGIRDENVIKSFLDAGAARVILGTAAVTNRDFLDKAVSKYGEKIAVGVDIRGESIAIKGWTETAPLNYLDFFRRLEKIGVQTVICTDISKDGAMKGTNLPLYSELSKLFEIDIIASGGISSLSDIGALREMKIYGAILGKALYTGDISLEQAIKTAKELKTS